jgi:hypothetical protein
VAEKADIADFKPHDLRWASTNANAVVGNPFWVERHLDHAIGGVAGTYGANQRNGAMAVAAPASCATMNSSRSSLWRS